ncbi:MAG: DNA-directed RNA polymerase subunit alpha [Deltaproteobacteria bacterium]|nr:DNA-directed RNA polymerase subunit alpha [Deltaproteobacteria bacterium]
MYQNWRSMIYPKGLVFDADDVTSTYGKFEVRPLERGFGTTIGNSLRRVLLSSLQGAAIVGVKIDGVLHEFSTVPGVREDVSDILLNLKQVRVRLHEGREATLTLTAKAEGVVTAGQIEAPAQAEILNPDQHIATIGPSGTLKMEMIVRMGKGYVAAEQNKDEQFPVGMMALDALYAPVRRVNYMVTNARVGQITDYDRLVLEVWTDGSVRPDDAIAYSAKILKEQLQLFINFEEVQEPVEVKTAEESQPLNENLYRRVDELELSVRSANCLANANIKYIGELCQYSEAEMLKTKNFGRKSLNEIKEIVHSMGLALGMKLDGFDPMEAERFRPKEVE